MPTAKNEDPIENLVDALKRQIVRLEKRIDKLEEQRDWADEYEMIDPRAPITAGPTYVTLRRRMVTK